MLRIGNRKWLSVKLLVSHPEKAKKTPEISDLELTTANFKKHPESAHSRHFYKTSCLLTQFHS